MLVIQKRQIEAFEQAALKRFEDEMVAHCRQYAARLFEIRGENCIREVVRLGMARAKQYGFTNRGPMRFYIELMFALGYDFDNDPQLPWAKAILQDSTETDQMTRADRLHAKTSEYFDRVVGPNNSIAVEALHRLKMTPINQYLTPGNHFQANLFRALYDVYPQKYRYVGESALRILYSQGVEVTRSHAIPDQPGAGLIIALMFGFGHGIATDPLYPWVGACLSDSERAPPNERLQRLYKKTMTYVDGMLKHLGN